jgi:multidrug resistance efflux pump
VTEPPRRIPVVGALLAIAFLIIPIIAVAIWLNRPKAGPESGGSLSDLDVVCHGRIDGRTPIAHLEPTLPGKVVEVFVIEGQAVKAGDKLVKLDDESLKLREEEARQAVVAAEIEVETAQLEQQLHPRRRAIQEAAVAAAVDRAAAARSLYQERKTSRQFGTVTAAELLSAEAEVKQVDHLVEVEKARLDELEKIDPSLKLRTAEARRASAQVALKQAEKAVRDCTMIAPSNGVVLRVQTSLGESVVLGGIQPAIVFRPDGDLIVRAELEQEFIGRVKPGMKATIRDDVRPDSPTWNGTVLRIGNWVARKRSLLFEPGEMNDVRTVECIISLDGKAEGLLIGQRMRVRIGRQE